MSTCCLCFSKICSGIIIYCAIISIIGIFHLSINSLENLVTAHNLLNHKKYFVIWNTFFFLMLMVYEQKTLIKAENIFFYLSDSKFQYTVKEKLF